MLVVGVVVAGAFLGINNTVITEAVMGAAPVERPVASAAYSFVRFSGGAVAPYAAGKLGENVSVHAPFWMGAVAVAVGGRRCWPPAPASSATSELPAPHSQEEAEAELVGDLSLDMRRSVIATGARTTGPGARDCALRPAAQRLPRLSCSRSIASKSALKLPLPKPSEPCRSISSKNTVGRSPSGLVKICSR